MNPKVYILVLNWNNWRDTIECLESLQHLEFENYSIVVIDNDSTDKSVEKIKAWAEGRLEVESKYLEYDSSNKPVSYIEYNRAQAEAGGRIELENRMNSLRPDRRLVIIETGDNLGFAGGNNVGIRYALAKNDFEYIWLLNNDTVVETDTLKAMVERMREDDTVGMCGCTLLYYDQSDRIQALAGGTYNKWLGISKHVGCSWNSNMSIKRNKVERKIDYIVGASMLVSKNFIQDIGLLSEEYFLYFEETDWAFRSKERYRLAYAPDSVVYHKEGATIGSSSNPKEKSMTADYYGIKNRIVFTQKFFPWLLPTVYLGVIVAIVNRIRRGQWNRVKMILKILFGIKNADREN